MLYIDQAGDQTWEPLRKCDIWYCDAPESESMAVSQSMFV